MRKLTHVHLERRPRLADFVEWGVAIERALGYPEGTFLTAFDENRQVAEELAVEASPIAHAILSLADQRGGLPWKGTATELLATFAELVDDDTRRHRGWPKTPMALSNALNRIQPTLRGLGFKVGRLRQAGGNRVRLLTIARLCSTETVATQPHRPAIERSDEMCARVAHHEDVVRPNDEQRRDALRLPDGTRIAETNPESVRALVQLLRQVRGLSTIPDTWEPDVAQEDDGPQQ